MKIIKVTEAGRDAATHIQGTLSAN